MTVKDLERRGYIINGVFIAVNIALMIAVHSLKGKLSAVSYGYGAAVAQLFSFSWFLLVSKGLRGGKLVLAAFGGYFFRVVFLFLFLALAYKILELDLLWCAAAFLITRFILMGFEIVMTWFAK
jgi:hypothetical protein